MQYNPEAHICVKRNRVKQYSDKVYLQDKQEFEFELFNPTQKTQLAKIYINGKVISSSGIVLKPGERVYLERFIDTPAKFRFDTYSVDGSKEAQKAIQNNGDIKVEFYEEKDIQVGWFPDVYYRKDPCLDFFNTTCSTFSMDSNSQFSAQDYKLKSLVARSSAGGQSASLPKETGRVEKGSSSNQNFSTYSGEFNSYVSTNVFYKILPISAKPMEASDLVVYCTECGTKAKKGGKFCSNCGHKH